MVVRSKEHCGYTRGPHRAAAVVGSRYSQDLSRIVCSFLDSGEVEWTCAVCYHENHPKKTECILCGTAKGRIQDKELVKMSVVLKVEANGIVFSRCEEFDFQ